MGLTISPEDGETEVFGKAVSELQNGISVTRDAISGTLNYVEDYTEFSGDPELQEGNYLALKVGGVSVDDVVTVELVGGHSGPVTLDEDRNIVIRIEDTSVQTAVKVTVTDGTDTVTKTFDTRGLTLLSE